MPALESACHEVSIDTSHDTICSNGDADPSVDPSWGQRSKCMSALESACHELSIDTPHDTSCFNGDADPSVDPS